MRCAFDKNKLLNQHQIVCLQNLEGIADLKGYPRDSARFAMQLSYPRAYTFST